MLHRSKSAIAAVLLAALAASACGTISRETYTAARTSPLGPVAPDGIEMRASDGATLEALATQMGGRLSRTGAHVGDSILAMSGGGANGAYGAGVIAGWTETGHRPQFDVVTGISTGALAAPFAFLGPKWDGALKRVYTDGGTQNLFSWRNFAAFFAPSLFSPASLRKLVDANITPELMRQVAAENAKGRRLLVVTTNLDAQETVIWDMGALASRGDHDALLLFRRILMASSSIPGVFPPVLIAGRGPDGAIVDQMHVDGGVSTPFLAVPESLMLWSNPNASAKGGAIYVLVNGQLTPDYRTTPGDLAGILARSFDSMTKASLRTTLAANAAFAERNGMQLDVSEIPPGASASSLDLSKKSMEKLFEVGRSRAAAGQAWTPVTAQQVAAPKTEVRPSSSAPR
jgi:predicted patatin/cPLA2 family phospholipase/phage tail protein X